LGGFIKLLLLLVLFKTSFLYANNEATLKVALFDSGFCPTKYHETPKSISLNPVNFEALSPNTPTHDDCKKSKELKSLHGHLVLKALLKDLKNHHYNSPLKIYLYSIYDKNGISSYALWNSALKDSIKKGVHLGVSASSLVAKLESYPQLPPYPLLLAAGTKEGEITKNQIPWPQKMHQNKNIYLFGHYSKSLYDKKIDGFLPPSLITRADFYTAKNLSTFSGSSHAVSIGSARIIHLCHHKLLRFHHSCISAAGRVGKLESGEKVIGVRILEH
jgi:hypothetical protein